MLLRHGDPGACAGDEVPLLKWSRVTMRRSQFRAIHIKPDKALCVRLATCFNHLIVEAG